MYIPLCVVFNCYVVFKSDKNEEINQVKHIIFERDKIFNKSWEPSGWHPYHLEPEEPSSKLV